MENILELKNISKNFKNYKALDNVSFSLNEGEIIGLIGPNGAGKTTLMRIIVGLTKNYDGQLILKDGTSIGCVIETPSFYPYMTGYENLKYFASLNDVSTDKILETVKLLGLTDDLNKKVKGYSLGMRQRLGIANALLRDPKLLILDEPTNGLDPSGILEMRKYIKDIAKKQNITVLISSHILSELEKICDNAIIIQHGKIIDTFNINSLKNSNNVALKIGTTDINRALTFFNAQQIKILKYDADSISIIVPKQESKNIAQLLIKNKINFFNIYEEEESLEDKFLDLIQENAIV